MQITIRYFAAACQAVGRDSETIDVAEDSTESIVDLVRRSTPRDIDQLLAASSFLVNEEPVDAHASLAQALGMSSLSAEAVATLAEQGGIRLDVLPPFAGGRATLRAYYSTHCDHRQSTDPSRSERLP